MINAQLSITEPALARPARLRADRIRRDTLVQLAAALREADDNDLQNRLDRLIDATGHDVSDHALDELCADIEDLAGMGRADMPLTAGDLVQLAKQAAAALDALPTAGTVHHLPAQRQAGAA